MRNETVTLWIEETNEDFMTLAEQSFNEWKEQNYELDRVEGTKRCYGAIPIKPGYSNNANLNQSDLLKAA